MVNNSRIRHYNTKAKIGRKALDEDGTGEGTILTQEQKPPYVRWKMSVDRAARLMSAVAEEMRADLANKPDGWFETFEAERFQQAMEAAEEMFEMIDDARYLF